MEILARAVGRRKEAVAQILITSGTGQFLINNKDAKEYLQNNACSLISVKAPFLSLEKTDGNNCLNLSLNSFDTIVKVNGGGLIGQAEAIKLGVARALCELETLNSESKDLTSQTEVRKQLKMKGYLTQDSRVKERRKYGLKKARKASQYNKR
jgi:small subunit ribosomal protein S9